MPNFFLILYMRIMLFICLLCFSFHSNCFAQKTKSGDTVDISLLVSKALKKDTKAKGSSGLAILPSLGYNPSMGLMIGANATASLHLGESSSTRLSSGTATAFVTSKGIINLQLRHNIFTEGNKWLLQGNLQASRMLMIDYGLGTASMQGRGEGISLMGFPLKNASASYPVSFGLFRLNEKAYRKINESLFIGGGINIDIHTNIKDEKLNLDSGQRTPHFNYSVEKGVNPRRYFANGVMFNIQYNTKEHPNRSFGGMYADLVIRANSKFLGSSLNSLQLMTEFKKYWSLSKRNPEHVIAVWHLGTYRLNGDVPYLDLPGTAGDLFNRSGRGYTIGRFKGPSYAYLETEYRFPISSNKLFSGVVFANVQTASDGKKVKLFDRVEPAAGGGLRVLFKKESRTSACIDYAFGRYGSSGLFFGLNEVF